MLLTFLKFFSIMFGVLFLSSIAQAHPPYLIKQGLTQDPNGNVIIKEKRYGDGIVAPDPFTFQLRNKNGAVIADSSASFYLPVFCPNLDLCWVFPYRSFSLWASAMTLDMDALDFDKPVPEYDFDGQEEAEFQDYLTNTNTKLLEGYYLKYPEYEDSLLAFKPSMIATIISPIVIIVDNIIALLIVLMTTVFIYILYGILFVNKNADSKFKVGVLYIFGFLVMGGYLFAYAILMLLIGYLAMPFFYLLLTMFLGSYLGKRMRRRK